jgi:chromosome condensin MukBEF ATPase and DNA-binding subunit MukB
LEFDKSTGKVALIMFLLKEDKEFAVTLAKLQAQVNPEKVDDHFKRMKKAFYPYLAEHEERQAKDREKKLMDMAKKGTLMKFKTEPTVREQTINLARQFRDKVVQEESTRTKFQPQPRKR